VDGLHSPSFQLGDALAKFAVHAGLFLMNPFQVFLNLVVHPFNSLALLAAQIQAA